MGRRLARELALKVLYRYEEGDKDLPSVMNAILERKKYKDKDKEFCRQLINKTTQKKAEIDDAIIGVLENWPYDRIAVVDKIILRMGTCELLYFDDVPGQVSINEAIEIAKVFGGKNSGKFVNGILDAIKKKHESSDN